MARWIQLTRLEGIIVGISLLLFIGSVGLLIKFDDIFLKAEIDPRDVIGELLSSYGEMKRRVPDRLEFTTINKGALIGNGDSLFTGKASKGTLRLDEQNIFILEEETLLVVRKSEAGYNIQVKRGNLSGTIDQKSVIEFQTDEESLILDGKEVTEFTLRYLPQFGLSLGSVEVTRNLRKGGASARQSEEAVKVTNSEKSDESKGSVGAVKEEETLAQGQEVVPDSSKPLIRPVSPLAKKGFRKQSPILIGGVSYEAPYPRQDQILLFKNGGSFLLLPKIKCQEMCALRVMVNGVLVVEKRFLPGKVPVLRFPVGENLIGEISWELRDGSVPMEGSFQIAKFDKESFAKALREKRDIEVLD